MDLVLIVSLNGLEDEKIVKTKIGRRTVPDSQPLSLNERINWYAEFSLGDEGFVKMEDSSSIQKQADLNARWARQAWNKSSYGIRYYIVTEDQANKLIETNPHPYKEQLEDEI